MSDLLLITISGLGLGSLYFLLSSGLSLIFGLMHVLSFAHGVFLTLSAYTAWAVMKSAGDSASTIQLLGAIVISIVVGGALAFVTEFTVIRRLRGNSLQQLLATVGIGTAGVALVTGIWGPDSRLVRLPGWVTDTTDVFGASIPNTRFMLIVAAVAVLVAITVFLSRTRYGLVIRAGVENSEMVSALGINVDRSFTFVFTIGGALAGLGGGLAACYYRGVSPFLGDQMLIYSFIVLIIGGLGSIQGAAIAAVVLGLSQSLANFYVSNGSGDVLVVLLLVATLLVRPQGILGHKERLV